MSCSLVNLMCGLVGTVLPEHIAASDLEKIRAIFVNNLLANEIRGPKATGVVVSQADGTVFSLKQPIAASKFVETPEFKEFMAIHVNLDTRLLLGHTRDPTKGSINNHVNNHPIIVGDTVGVHNGVITNDDAIFLELAEKNHLDERIGSVDSEAIFALFDEVGGECPLAEYVTEISARVRLLCGSFTTLFFNKKKPTQLFCLRYDNPISCHFDEALGCLFFSSRYIFLRKTFGRVVISEGMSGKTGFVFDALTVQQGKKEPICTFPLQECVD